MPVHFSTVADLHNKDSQNQVFDAADDAVVANAVFPKLTQAGASESLPDTAGVVEHSDTVTQKSKDGGVSVNRRKFRQDSAYCSLQSKSVRS